MEWSLSCFLVLLAITLPVTLVPAANFSTSQFPATESLQNATGSNDTSGGKNITGINQVMLNESQPGHNVSANESNVISTVSSVRVGNQSEVAGNETKVDHNVTATESKNNGTVLRLFNHLNCSTGNGTSTKFGSCEASVNATGKGQFVAGHTKEGHTHSDNHTWTAFGNGTREGTQNITVVHNNVTRTQNISIFTNSSVIKKSSNVTLNNSSQETGVRTTSAPTNMMHNATRQPQFLAHNTSTTRNGTFREQNFQNFTSSMNLSTKVTSSPGKLGVSHTHSPSTASKSDQSTSRTLISTTSASQHDKWTNTSEEGWKHGSTAKDFFNTVNMTMAPTKNAQSTLKPHRTFSKGFFGHTHGLIWQITQDQHYVKNVLLPIGCGIAGALMIVSVAYFMKSCRKRKRFVLQQEPKAEATTQMDHVMLLADSSDEELY